MVTSRSLLRVEGEHALPVPPLLLPKTHATMTLDDWLHVPVIKLFIERAGAVDPSLAWKPDDILRLVEICGRLDGLPLAIELAATRVRHFTLGEINDRLNDLLPLLVDGSRDHPSRLQTMRNAIAWSYDLLSPGAQALLRQASVFSGGFTLDALAAVSGDLEASPLTTGADDPGNRLTDATRLAAVEDRLSMLIDSSLLIREVGPLAGSTRYRMLETIREFAWDQLETHGEAHRARHAHAAYFTTYAVQHEIAELTPVHVHFMDQIIVEQGNLRSALAWLEASPDRELFGRLVATLGRFWLAHSNYQEGRTWSERALAVRDTLAPIDVARILVTLGFTEIFQGENEAAETHLAQGVVACGEHGEAYGAVLALIGQAGLAVDRGDGERSTHLLEQTGESIAAIPDTRLAGVLSGWVSANLGVAARTSGRGDLAETHFEDALGRFKAEQFNIGTMMALCDLGDLARDRGAWPQALSLYREALMIGRTDQAKRFVIEVIEAVAIVAAHAGQWERSVTLLGAAEGLRERIGLRYRQPRNRLSLEEAIATTRAGLSAETFAAAWDTGRNLTESQAIARILEPGEGTASSQASSLTARESEILRLLATGMTDPEIADALFISVRTVEHHVANVYRKLGVRTRAAATSTAIAAGLVAAGGPA
jgi:non-specific serine/threonine protein kinase